MLKNPEDDLVPNICVSQRGSLFFVFLYCLGLLSGGAYQFYLSLDYGILTDGLDYLNMTKGNYDVSITRRYRVITPMLASVLSIPLERLNSFLWPHREGIEWTIRLANFLVNLGIMTSAGTVIFLICRRYGASVIASLLALTAVLVSRWGLWSTGAPNSDALYLLVIVLIVYGLKAKEKWPLIIAIFVGPFAKESFIFLAPAIILFGRNIIGIYMQIALFLLSGILVFGFRYWLDTIYIVEYSTSMQNAFDHFENVRLTYDRMFSLRGLGELFGVWGVFSVVIVLGFWGNRNDRDSWMRFIDRPLVYIVPCMILHAVISVEVSRMLYFASPVFAVAFALIVDKHRLFQKYREWLAGYHKNTTI